jgi:hypothetical protein
MEKELKAIEEVEAGVRNKLADCVKQYHALSVWFPTSFYLATSAEIGSQGYLNYLDFYDYLIDMKHKFISFWVDRVYHKNPKEMVSFIKGDENVFRGKSKLPPTFVKGVIINTAYVVILMLLSYWAFVYSLFRMTAKETETLNGAGMALKDGQYKVWYTKGDPFKKMAFNLFSGNFKMLGRKGFEGKMSINQVDIAKEKYPGKFIFICKPSEIPGEMKVRRFFRYYASSLNLSKEELGAIMEKPGIKEMLEKRFMELDEKEQFHWLWGLLEFNHKKPYIIDINGFDLSTKYLYLLKRQFEKVVSKGSIIVLLSHLVKESCATFEENRSYFEANGWGCFVSGKALEEKAINPRKYSEVEFEESK